MIAWVCSNSSFVLWIIGVLAGVAALGWITAAGESRRFRRESEALKREQTFRRVFVSPRCVEKHLEGRSLEVLETLKRLGEARNSVTQLKIARGRGELGETEIAKLQQIVNEFETLHKMANEQAGELIARADLAVGLGYEAPPPYAEVLSLRFSA